MNYVKLRDRRSISFIPSNNNNNSRKILLKITMSPCGPCLEFSCYSLN